MLKKGVVTLRRSSKTKLLRTVVLALFVLSVIGHLAGWSTAWQVLNMTNLVAFIAAGLVMIVLDIDSNRWGSIIYGLIAMYLFVRSMS